MKITANENEINDILQTYCKSTVHIANLLYEYEALTTETENSFTTQTLSVLNSCY